MIVVDTNVVHYCWVRGQHTEIAQAVRQRDPDWHVPILWRSEMRNVLTAYLRRGLLSRPQIVRILNVADQALAESEHMVADDLAKHQRGQNTQRGHILQNTQGGHILYYDGCSMP